MGTSSEDIVRGTRPRISSEDLVHGLRPDVELSDNVAAVQEVMVLEKPGNEGVVGHGGLQNVERNDDGMILAEASLLSWAAHTDIIPSFGPRPEFYPAVGVAASSERHVPPLNFSRVGFHLIDQV